MIRILSLATVLCIALGTYAVAPQTYEYAISDGDTLYMDVYMPADSATSRTAVLFAFGGGFTHGSRDDARYRRYFDFLADNGIVAVSADYRTTLAKDPSLLTSAEGVAKAFTGAISDAVADFYAATYYLVQNAAYFGIDASKIIASGSSAGAITALQAEYGLCNGQYGGVLPEGFHYAGVVSFAGAVMSIGDMDWASTPCPMQLFHGNADRNVPYSRLTAGPASLNGSEAIAASLAAKAVPCELYTFAGADHAIALSPMTDNLYDILGFIKRISENDERLSVSAMVTTPGTTPPPTPTISIADVVKANL